MADEQAPERQQPRDLVRLELGEPFVGWWLQIDADFTLGTASHLNSGDLDRVRLAIADLVVDWNFVDKRGKPLPADEAGVGGIGLQLLQATIDAIQGHLAVPKA